MGLCIRAKCDPMMLKQLFFFNYKKLLSGWGLRPQQTPVNNTFELQYTSLFNMSLNLDIFTF